MGYDVFVEVNKGENMLHSFLVRNRKYILIGAVSTLSFGILSSGLYITQEGYRGVVRTLGEVTDSTEPGLHYRFPFFQVVDLVEIRPRKYELVLQASTTGKTKEGNVELQMPSYVTITGNWTVDANQVKEIVSKFGSIQQFEDRILDPRVKEAVLSEFPKFTIEEVMTDRTRLSGNIYMTLKQTLADFPVVMTDMMVSNIDWHDKIELAVLNKQDAKLKKEEEEYRLGKQNLEAQQKVNTAKAEAEAIERMAEAEARAIKLRGEAEAEAIKAKAEALKQNPNLIQLIHEERWDGKLPYWLSTGDGQNLLFSVPVK
jgi:regulator of protease activity HflC (stomatin/prohibitin superfamily)